MVRNEHLLRYFKYNLPWSLAFQLITSIEAFSQGVWWRHPTTHRSPRTSTFLKIKLSNRCFSGNSLLLHCQRYLNIFCPARSSISSRGFSQCFFSYPNRLSLFLENCEGTGTKNFFKSINFIILRKCWTISAKYFSEIKKII